MTTLLTRELRRIARRRAFGVVLILHAGVMTAFVLGWSGGPARAMQFAVLAFLLPWTAARIAPVRSTPLPGARVFAVILALALVVAAAFPVMLLADRMAGTALRHTVRDELQVQLLSMAVVVVLLGCRRVSTNRVAAWAGATAVTVLVVAARLLSGLIR